jgi:hypothetical protein
MRGLLFALLLAPAAAGAWPVDWVHDVEPGREKFVRLPALDWFEVDDPKVLQVEWLESGELLLVGLKPGRALVLLGAEGRVAAWRVRVGTKPVIDAAALSAAQRACPDLALSPLEEVKLTVTVRDEPCRQALLTLFQGDGFEARHLALTFEGKVLQAQLAQLQEAVRAVVKGRVSARFVGAGLVLEGTATAAEKRRLLWEVLRRSLGRFALDDRVDVPRESPDGGSPR